MLLGRRSVSEFGESKFEGCQIIGAFNLAETDGSHHGVRKDSVLRQNPCRLVRD
jgi:hypothetical protein